MSEEMDEKTTRLVMIAWNENRPVFDEAHKQATQAANILANILFDLQHAGDGGEMREAFIQQWNSNFFRCS